MKQAVLLLIPLLLAACGRADEPDAGGSGQRESRTEVQTADLTGLYEAREESGRRGRICMISGDAAVSEFGLVTETPDGASCGGAGEAARDGDLLRLTMGGDEQCVIEAQIDGRRVTLPQSLPVGCSYYCGPGASLAGADFEKTGGTAEDAMRAIDLAGDPLCG